MHADGKSTLASVSKWNSGKVYCGLMKEVIFCIENSPGPALIGEAATHARTIFRGKNFEFKIFLEVKILSK